MVKRRYKRYFVILEEEDRGFSTSSSEGVKGYGKIEVRNDKGTLSLYCQNLRALEEKKESYRLYLISTKDAIKPIVIDIGPISADNNGRGEIIWTFNAENVKGSKRTLENFDTMALVVETLEESQRVVAPLVGYIHKEKTSWKSILQKELYFSNKSRQEKTFETFKEKALQEPLETNEIKDINDVKEDSKEVNKIQVDERNTEFQSNVKPEELMDNEEATKEEEVIIYEDMAIQEEVITKDEGVMREETIAITESSPLEVEDIKSHKEHSFQEDWDVETTVLQQYIEATLKIFPRVELFDRNLRNYKWWQIQYNTQTIYRSYMPFISHLEILHNPYYYHYPYYYTSEYQNQLYRYQHYIFGIAYDEEKRAKYYVYGIPGKRTIEDQPYGGETGFIYWHPYNYTGLSQEDFGYWLLHIDANTNGVVEPLMETEI